MPPRGAHTRTHSRDGRRVPFNLRHRNKWANAYTSSPIDGLSTLKHPRRGCGGPGTWNVYRGDNGSNRICALRSLEPVREDQTRAARGGTHRRRRPHEAAGHAVAHHGHAVAGHGHGTACWVTRASRLRCMRNEAAGPDIRPSQPHAGSVYQRRR